MDTNLYFDAILLGSCGYAYWRGGSPERIVASIFILGVLFTRVARSNAAISFTSVEAGILLVDLSALAALLVVALRAERFWPLWVTALHAIGTAGHAVKWADPEVSRWGYAFALAFWSYPMLALLAIGTFCHRRRLARHGVDRSWSSSSLRSELPRRFGPIA